MAGCRQSRSAHVRTLFLSDIHLGFNRSRARDLAEFLASVDADTIVLVGDIIDSLSLAQKFFGRRSTRRSCRRCAPNSVVARAFCTYLETTMWIAPRSRR